MLEHWQWWQCLRYRQCFHLFHSLRRRQGNGSEECKVKIKRKSISFILQKITKSINSASNFQVVALFWVSVAPPQPPGQCQPGFVAPLVVLKLYKIKQSCASAKIFLQFSIQWQFSQLFTFFSLKVSWLLALMIATVLFLIAFRRVNRF